VAVHPFLIGHRQADQTHATQKHKTRFGSQGKQAALQFLLIGLPLNRCSHAGCIRAGSWTLNLTGGHRISTNIRL
jgi:hypothetical protein